MKIAFASKENKMIDEHFGWCQKFFVYEVNRESVSFLKEIDSSLRKEDESEKLFYKIECIAECDIVYVLQIGPKAAAMVQRAGIIPLRSADEHESVDAAILKVQTLIKEEPPLWLQRILLKHQDE
ncbi:MAG: dinitrogenase iron-molybdenum cofactor biosynthesis protein [Campylobacterales bacterium]|nr:dinitrogenase iron-molybdenum cofactor biosynthesis protein [Campylobacterales bacterium]